MDGDRKRRWSREKEREMGSRRKHGKGRKALDTCNYFKASCNQHLANDWKHKPNSLLETGTLIIFIDSTNAWNFDKRISPVKFWSDHRYRNAYISQDIVTVDNCYKIQAKHSDWLAESRVIFTRLLYLISQLGVTQPELGNDHKLWENKNNRASWRLRNFDDKFIVATPSHIIAECHWRKDGRTDWIPVSISGVAFINKCGGATVFINTHT